MAQSNRGNVGRTRHPERRVQPAPPIVHEAVLSIPAKKTELDITKVEMLMSLSIDPRQTDQASGSKSHAGARSSMDQTSTNEHAELVFNPTQEHSEHTLEVLVTSLRGQLRFSNFYTWMRQSIVGLWTLHHLGVSDIPIRPKTLASTTKRGVLQILKSTNRKIEEMSVLEPEFVPPEARVSVPSRSSKIPETLARQAAAVYTWGVTFCLLLCRTVHVDSIISKSYLRNGKEYTHNEFIKEVNTGLGKIPTKTKGEQQVFDIIHKTLMATLQFNPKNRPSFVDIYQQLLKIGSFYESSSQSSHEENKGLSKPVVEVSQGNISRTLQEQTRETDPHDMSPSQAEREEARKLIAEQRAIIASLQTKSTSQEEQIKDQQQEIEKFKNLKPTTLLISLEQQEQDQRRLIEQQASINKLEKVNKTLKEEIQSLTKELATLRERIAEKVSSPNQQRDTGQPATVPPASSPHADERAQTNSPMQYPYQLELTDCKKVLETSKWISNPPIGLVNLGSTCFFNSFLQCLSATPRLIYELSICKGTLSTSETTLRKYIEGHKAAKGVFAPTEIHGLLGNLDPKYKSYGQQDALIALILMLSKLNPAVNVRIDGHFKDRPVGKIFSFFTINQYLCPSCNVYSRTLIADCCCILPIDFAPTHPTLVTQSVGQIQKYKAVKFQLTNMELLDVLVPHKSPILKPSSTLSVQDLLNQYFAPTLVADYICNVCNKTSKAQEELLIMKPPHVLILNPKRYIFSRYTVTKNTEKVMTNITLTLDEAIVICKNDITESDWKHYSDLHKGKCTLFEYELYGVVCHSGSMSGGHYVAYVRIGTDWYHTSDLSVRKSSEAEALKAEAYILFYERRAGSTTHPI